MVTTGTSHTRTSRWLTAGLMAIGAMSLIITALRVTTTWPLETYLGYTEGTWTAIAIDLAKGIFYRPLESDLGYGGTRYFPLFFTLHGALIRLGLSSITAGHVVAAVSVLALVAAVAWLVRLAGGRPLMAFAAAAVTLACQPTQMAVLTIRGDALATALALAGVALAATRRPAWLVALAFTLAVATKPTSLYAPAATVLWFWIAGDRRSSWRLAAHTVLWLAFLLVAMQVASAGRALSVISASAIGGGTWRSLLSAPVALAHILRRVPESVVFIAAAAALVVWQSRTVLTIERITFVLCALATVAIFASPATVENHLIDLTAWSVVVVAGWAGRAPRRATVAMALVLIGGVIAGTTATMRWRERDRIDARTARERALAAVADAHGPVFVEQPMLAAKAGWQTYLIDPYLFSLQIAQDPGALDRLITDLRGRRFGAVILEHAALDLAVQDTFPGPAGPRFLSALHDGYALDRVVDGRPIFRPR
ncbi:MAG: hypothetical protein ABI634_04470 [Acidobacteriota bacterium]